MSTEKEYAILIHSDKETIAGLQDKILSGLIKAFQHKILEKNEKGEMIESSDF